MVVLQIAIISGWCTGVLLRLVFFYNWCAAALVDGVLILR